MDRLIRFQAASNYTGLDSRSAGEKYVVVYLAPEAQGAGGAEGEMPGATLQLNEDRMTVPAEFADAIPAMIESSGLAKADGLTEWNPELPPNIGFHALACEFESGRIFKTSASGFSDVWAAFAGPLMELVRGQFGRSAAPAEPEMPAEPEAPVEDVTPAEPEAPVAPIYLGPVKDVKAEPLIEPETFTEPEVHVEGEPLEEPGLEYFTGDENEEWLTGSDDLEREIRSADAEIDLAEAELDSVDAKLDLAEAQLDEMGSALDAAEAVLSEAKAKLEK